MRTTIAHFVILYGNWVTANFFTNPQRQIYTGELFGIYSFSVKVNYYRMNNWQ